ncbi:MAG: hypothetical protein ACOX4K_02455 [Bacillota bacterium]
MSKTRHSSDCYSVFHSVKDETWIAAAIGVVLRIEISGPVGR